jgi:hypothetical protein
MVQDPVVERLVQSAVARCRERIVSAKKRIDPGANRNDEKRNGERGIQREPPSITGAMKRFRGL